MDSTQKLYHKTGDLSKLGEAKLVKKLSKEIGFEQNELKRLIAIYKEYLKETGYMDHHAFSKCLHNSFGFSEDFFINRIFLVADTEKDDRIDLEEFIRVVAIMLRGSRREQIQLCFKCYDLSDSNELTRDDLLALLLEGITASPFKEVKPETMGDLAEMMISRMDQDHDGVITLDEFKHACLKNWLTTESFGQCLPDHHYRAALMILLETDKEIESLAEESSSEESD